MTQPDDSERRRLARRARRAARRKKIQSMGESAWRLFPFRGRFITPTVGFVFERLPEPPATFSAADVALLCVEADRVVPGETPCDPAETIDLLTSRGLVRWTDDGFVKTGKRKAKRPRA